MAGLDFVVIGAQKCGTTTLWRLLRDHPQLALPADKEAAFFADDRLYSRGVDWCLNHFFGATPAGVLRGTVTPAYMKGVRGPNAVGMPVETIVRRIAEHAPQAKLIAVVRDPVERAISHFRMSARRGIEERRLEQALTQALLPAALAAARARPSETNSYLTGGEYGRVLAAYRRHFPAERMLVLRTDELAADPEALLARICGFLGVDAEWQAEDPHLRAFVGGSSTRVPADEAATLVRSLGSVLPDHLVPAAQIAVDEWNTIPSPHGAGLPEDLRERLRRHFGADGRRLEALSGVRIPWATAPPPPPRIEPAQAPEVSLVILAHDTPADVEALLASIARHTREPCEVVLVDNGSSLGAREAHERLAETYGAQLLALEDNLSFSVANNIGFRATRGQEVAFLNSDVVATPRWLANLRTALASAPDVGAVGPRSNFAPGPQGGLWLDDSTEAGVQAFGRFFNHPDPARWFDIEWLAGFAVLARRSALEAIGGFDESVPWFGGEDIRLSHALRDAGWRLLCAGDTFLYHAGHHTFFTTGRNRSSTRFGRPAADAPLAGGPARLVRDENGWVFEVRDGVASHLETWYAALLVKAGRPLEDATPAELAGLPIGPPISMCRTRGSDDVWVLHSGVRRRVLGDGDRIRRLPGLAMRPAQEIASLPEGDPVEIADAFPPVPEMRVWLPDNPIEIELDRLAGSTRVSREIATALRTGRGYAFVRIDATAIAVLNHGLWPHPQVDPAAAGARCGALEGARALRRAIVGADAVAVPGDPGPAGVLAEVLFHYDLFPRLLCAGEVGRTLLGLPAGGAHGRDGTDTAASGTLHDLVREHRVAFVCPAAVAGSEFHRYLRGFQRAQGFDVRVSVGLDDLDDVESAFTTLAANRGAYDVVLAAAGLPGAPLCARLARELGVVALDVGSALDELGLLHPRLHGGANPLVRLSADVARQLDQEIPRSEHELEGRLVRSEAGGDVHLIEGGRVRRVLGERLLTLFDQPPLTVADSVLRELAQGPPVCPVHEPLTGLYVLLGGRKVPLELDLPIVAVADMALGRLDGGDQGA